MSKANPSGSTQFGWTSERFKIPDQQIASRENYHRIDTSSRKTDRYGKKYSWIAYYEMAGLQLDAGKVEGDYLDYRSAEADIDPSFPWSRPDERLIKEDFLGDPSVSIRDWIEKGSTPNIAPYLRQKTALGHAGPWVALDGYISAPEPPLLDLGHVGRTTDFNQSSRTSAK